MNLPAVQPVVLISLDGWGVRGEAHGNAIKQAQTPVMTGLAAHYPSTTIGASGEAVGLPAGLMGNSEVGHLNMGAGRTIYQELVRINKAISDGSFYGNETLLAACEHARASGGKLHLMGLLSDGGVHSEQAHLYALLELARRQGLDHVYVHAFLDGRDTPPASGAGYVEQLLGRLSKVGTGRLATISGRYYAMDRDNRWDRTARAYRALVLGEGHTAGDPVAAVRAGYRRRHGDMVETDEFFYPTVLLDGRQPVATVEDGDAVIFFNFRPDRANQLTLAMTGRDFDGFPREPFPRVHFVCFCLYNEAFGLPIAFPPTALDGILGQVVSEAGLRQYRTAETEKFRHVTSFFNGRRMDPFPGEDRLLVPSPKVSTYDVMPEMSAAGVADAACQAIEQGIYSLIVINFANADMVGHTGILPAAIKGVEAVDAAVGRVADAARARGAVTVITADHGNAELMINPDTGGPHTAHTTSPVPLIVVGDALQGRSLLSGGIMADVAPTVLDLMGLPQPPEMTGRSLLQPAAVASS